MVPLLLFSLLSSPSSSAPVAETSFGLLVGYSLVADNGRLVHVFKSVPFASPPVGSLRWSLPRDPLPWKGRRDASHYSPACLSNSTTSFSPQKVINEDCLYLNIFTSETCMKSGSCPVVVYIHGGGMNYDSAVYLNDAAIIRNFASKDIVFAIPGYRLGFTELLDFGPLEEETIPSNLGVHDVVHSLRFLHSEGRHFGGDSLKTTLMGHSSGAAMAVILAYSPLRKDIPLVRVIAMSGFIQFEDSSLYLNNTRTLVELAGCSRATVTETIDCLRSRDVLQLLSYQVDIEMASVKHKSFGSFLLRPPLFPWKSIPEMLANPPEGIALMIGSTAKELDTTPGHEWMDTRHGNQPGILIGARNIDQLDELYKEYIKANHIENEDQPGSATIALSALLTAQSMAGAGNGVFLYSFDQSTHSLHTDDLFYVMGVHGHVLTEDEKGLALFYPELFANFSSTGVPSPNWKQFDPSTHSYYSIRNEPSKGRYSEMKTFYHAESMDFWIRIAPAADEAISRRRAETIGLSLSTRSSLLSDFSPLRYGAVAVFFIVCVILVVALLSGRRIVSSRFNHSSTLLARKRNEERTRLLSP